MLQRARRMASWYGSLARLQRDHSTSASQTIPATISSTASTASGIAQRQWRCHQPGGGARVSGGGRVIYGVRQRPRKSSARR